MNVSMSSLLEKKHVSASAPCRIDMGGTLDLSTFFLPLHHLEPCTFNIALNLRTRVTLSSHRPGRVKIISRGFEPVEAASDAAPFDHPLGLMFAVAAFFHADGVLIEIDSASPPRSALGGSSVAAVALIRAFTKLLHSEDHPLFRPAAVASLAHAIEQSVAGVPCGRQDQLAAAYGGVNAWLWTGGPDGHAYKRKVPVDPHDYPALSRRILVAYCGQPHVSKDINGAWVRAFVAGTDRRIWQRIAAHSRTFVDALAQGRLDAAKAAMNAETELRREMTPDVLDDVGRLLVDKACEMGCGARFTGAGGGGCVWALADPADIANLRSAWQEILVKRPGAAILECIVDKDGVL